MRDQFYHDGLPSPADRPRRIGVLVAVATLALAGCSPPPPSASGTPAVPSNSARPAPTPAATADDGAATPTAAAVARGRELIEQLRAAAGGAALTGMRSLEITGTSLMPSVRPPRRLSVIARFPTAFRMEESSTGATKAPGPRLAMGLSGDRAWMAGAILGGDGQSKDAAVAQRAYARAVRQTMAGLLAGINAPWLMDTGRYSATDGGVIDSGEDQGALQVILDGPDGRVGRLIIDPKSHLPRRLIEPPQPSGGGPAALSDIVYSYSDFQIQRGVAIPKTITRQNASVTTTWTLDKVVLNPPIPASRFTPRGR